MSAMSSSAGAAAPRGNISGYKLRNVPNYTPGQMQLFEKLFGGLMGGGGLEGGLDFLSKLAGGSEEGFAQAEKPAYSAFQKTLGDIGSRFAGYGGGSLDSSAFQQATSGAARELSENLGAKRMGIQNDAISKLLGLSQDVLSQRPYDSFLEQKSGGFDWGGLLGQLLGGMGGPIAGGIGKAALPKILQLLGLGG